MNLYKICYTSAEHGPLEALIAERNEAAAVKRAKKTRNIKRIDHVERLRENIIR